jgi:hypothetical protein
VIAPGYERLGEELIDRCLSILKAKGVEGAVVKWSGFPALAVEELGEDVPPVGLACNPPWYVDLLERKGFTRYKEWVNYGTTLPSRIPKEDLDRVENLVKALHLKVGLLKWRKRRDVDDFFDLQEMILEGENSFGYAPSRDLKRDDGFLRYLFLALAMKLFKTSVFVVQDSSGRVVGSLCYSPNQNVPLKPLRNLKRSWTKPGTWSTVVLARYIIGLRRTRRAQIKGFGFVPEIRGRNVLVVMDYMLNLLIDQGYDQLDTGPVRVENRVVIKTFEHFARKHGRITYHTSYYTLLHMF